MDKMENKMVDWTPELIKAWDVLHRNERKIDETEEMIYKVKLAHRYMGKALYDEVPELDITEAEDSLNELICEVKSIRREYDATLQYIRDNIDDEWPKYLWN